MTLSFILNSLLLGVGLAMDAFSVSLANGLSEPKMRVPKALSIAGCFALFQAAMPFLGWLCVHAAVETFRQNAVDIYMDIANLFLRLLIILSKSRRND